ncbi:protein LDOC1-like [Eublepharis macularius]|uniref:Protein LDOC1-like n=1 Tax=Eublepharis macularius TaxID=481883 RepID=A0AA97KN57_EUBMA|nr:protein LDOC1-like [Eublepharis macularius]
MDPVTAASLVVQNQVLQQQVDQLTDVVMLLQQQLQQQSQVAAPAAPVVPPKCPISPPKKFAGDVDEFPGFLAQYHLYISLRPRDFPDDQTKVGFILSLLKGQAANWSTPLLLESAPLLQDYNRFIEQLQVAFANPIKAENANRRILHQGRGSVAVYTAEFQLLAQDLS